MSTIAVIGTTGYAGGHITAEALRRGHHVIGVRRTASTPVADGVEDRTGSIADRDLMAQLFADSDAVVVAIPGALNGESFLVDYVDELLALGAEHGTRLGVVGGAGSLSVSPGGPKVVDRDGFPEEHKPEARAHARALDALKTSSTSADWFYVSPPAIFGSWAPGERRGSYRLGDDVLLVDADGKSTIGGEDFAAAFVDEIERPAHHRARFTVAY